MTPEEVLSAQKENIRTVLKETVDDTMEEYKHQKNCNQMGNDVVKEKVYCYNHPGMYYGNNNSDAVALAAMLRNNDNEMLPMMAMGGMNQQWNNPFIYLVWMMMAQRMWNQNGDNANSAQFQELQAQLTSLRTQMQDNQNSNMIMDAVKGNTAQLGQLANQLNCDFNTLSGAICDVRGGIDRLAGQVGFSAERVINSVQMGDMNIISTLKDCCCQNKELVQRMGYENQLGQKDIVSGFTKGFCDLSRDILFGFDRTNTAIERAASAQAYENQRLMCELKNNQNDNTQRIIDTLNTHWKEELAGKLQKAEFENSQLKQNQYLANLITGGCGCQGYQQ